MNRSDEDSFELQNVDDAPTKQLTLAIDLSAKLDEINLLQPGSQIGRYVIRKRIGAGGFGVVFLGEDSALKRNVCIKISRSQESSERNKRFSLIAEARSAASLDHPNVVRVFDTGVWNNYPYLISEYVDGATLGNEVGGSNPISIRRALMLMRQVALALVHLHSKGMIHRDLKPANILIGTSDVVKLADFGLAISDDMPVWNSNEIAGTQRYMAPEQVLGETHRIDGRTDIWGFGIVLYELLTAKPPFRSNDPKTLFQSILKGDAPSLRQRRPDVPQSLDQFCLRCLCQCMADRYQSATELLEELESVQRALEDSVATEPISSNLTPSHGHPAPVVVQDFGRDSGNANPSSGSTNKLSKTDKVSNTESTGVRSGTLESLAIVPRGLRSFEVEDHHFFVSLLPGPREATGIPLSLRFWKNWVASQDGERTQCVGVLYGPSGSGKSSFIRAGLLPEIQESTETVYMDFTVDRPIAALLSRLHKHFPESATRSDLASTLAFIRKKKSGKQTLLVLDQFEQYLANTPLDLQHELVQALRQCNGSDLKAILIVRDDFWNSISQFMHLLESSLSDHRNAMSLPLLTQRHAERTLEAIGRAYECLPKSPEPISESQRCFIEIAVQQLSTEGSVVCVRLTMFAELMRNHPWEPKTLSKLGGMDGAAMKYLQESFDAKTAPISHRSVASICREILRALLPNLPVETKSFAQSKNELSDLIQTASRVQFEQAIGILEKELRLISTVGQGDDSKPLYSLTHDYLVRPVRDWIFEHEQSTWQGRARSKLTLLAARFEREPTARNLPSVSEWFAIQSSIATARRTNLERQLMRSASRAVFAKLLSAVAAVTILLGGAWIVVRAQSEVWQAERSKAVSAVDLFLASKPDGLETAQKGLVDVKHNAIQVYESKRYLGQPDYDRRLTFLGAVLGAQLEADRLVEAVDESDIAVQAIWKIAFQNVQLRDSALKSSFFTAGFSPRMHWLFLANDDFRTLDTIELSSEPSPIVLCHQIVACALGESESAEDWNTAKLEEIVSQKPSSSELHALTTLLLGLVSTADPVLPKRIEIQSVASQASIAMPAQWYIEKSKNKIVEFANPESDDSDWRIERPLPGVAIPMIRLTPGAMAILPSSKQAEPNSKPITVVIDEGIWVAQERVSFELVSRFYDSLENQSEFEIRDRKGLGAFTSTKAVYMFCNWLSTAANYEPVYKIGDSADPESESKSGEKANGFRIPTLQERLYIATCAEQSEVLEKLYSNEKMFDSVRSRPMNFLKEHRAEFLSTPSPWGFKNIFSFPAEVNIVDGDSRGLVNSTPSDIPIRNLSFIQTKESSIGANCLRLVRGPIEQ